MSVTHGGVIVGNVSIKFEPRNSLFDFINETSKISLLRKVKGFPAAKNMAIRGENLATLAALKAGGGISGDNISVNVIYIDPPYNVGGNQGYNNKWRGVSEKERDWAKDHGKFLDFMEPRLKIGRSLLTDDGVIFVSICDGEYCRLKILMDEIFGESNCLGTLIWNQGRGSSSKHMAKVHEYVLVYAKNSNLCPPLREEKMSASPVIEKAMELKEKKIPYKEAHKEFESWLKNAKKEGVIAKNESGYRLHPKTFRPFQTTASCAQDNPDSRSHKKLKHPRTGKFSATPAKGWKWSESTLLDMYRLDEVVHGEGFSIAGKLCFGKDESSVPRKVQYLDEKQDQILTTMINVSHSLGKSDLPDGIEFTTPKPISFVKKLLKSYPQKDIVVLDYFAGSGATACAVHELNLEDGGNRRWIMVEEMNSTFNLVLNKRLEIVMPGSYGIYELQTATLEDKQLMKVFSQYSREFIASYHFLNTDIAETEQGMTVVGYDENSKCVVAIANSADRKTGRIEKELKLLKDKIQSVAAKKVLIYTINDGKQDREEPWKGLDKSVFAGTTCKELKVIEIPDQLVKEWQEVLMAMAA